MGKEHCIIRLIKSEINYLGDYSFAKSKGKTGREGIKKKGKEGLNKNRTKPGFVPRNPTRGGVPDIVNPASHTPNINHWSEKIHPPKKGGHIRWLLGFFGFYNEENE